MRFLALLFSLLASAAFAQGTVSSGSTDQPAIYTAKGTTVGPDTNIPSGGITGGSCGVGCSLTFDRSGIVTGATALSESPNTVLAGPGSGTTNGAPAYRALVNADIPSPLTITVPGSTATAGLIVGEYDYNTSDNPEIQVFANGFTTTITQSGYGNGSIQTSAYNLLLLPHSGMVYIGTNGANNPTEPLDVAGPIRAETDGYVNAAQNFTSTTLTNLTNMGSPASLIAGKTYAIDLWLSDLTFGTTSGYKCDLGGGTATATTFTGTWAVTPSSGTAPTLYQTTSLTTTANATAAAVDIHLHAVLTVNAAGTVIPRCALNTGTTSTGIPANGADMEIRALN
jgi:hypothetical protein